MQISRPPIRPTFEVGGRDGGAGQRTHFQWRNQYDARRTARRAKRKARAKLIATTRMPAIFISAHNPTTPRPTITPAMADGEPRHQAREVGDKERGINRHVKNAGDQRKPGFLKSPEISHRAADPRVVAAFGRQRAGKFADHERGRQAPQNRSEQQQQNAAPISRAMNNVFGAVGAAGHHEKCGSHQRPECEFRDSFWWKQLPGRKLGWQG